MRFFLYFSCVNDPNIHVYNLKTKTHKKLPTNLPSRQGHVIKSISDSTALLHGGMSGDRFFYELYSIDIDSDKIELIETDVFPVARAAHAAASYNQKLYIHGGLSNSGQALEDFWQFDWATKTWTDLTKKSQVALPTPRLSHSMTVLELPVFKSEHRCPTENKSEEKIIELKDWKMVADSQEVYSKEKNETIVLPEETVKIPVIAVFGGCDTGCIF